MTATALQCLCTLHVSDGINPLQGSQSVLMAVRLGTVREVVALFVCTPCVTELLRRSVLCSWIHDWSVTVPPHWCFPLLFLKEEVMEK